MNDLRRKHGKENANERTQIINTNVRVDGYINPKTRAVSTESQKSLSTEVVPTIDIYMSNSNNSILE